MSPSRRRRPPPDVWPPEPPDAPPPDTPQPPARKYYVDGGIVEIAAHFVYELDVSGKKLRVVKFTDYAESREVRDMWTSAAELRSRWSNAEERAAVLEALEEHGITLEQLAENAGQPDADPFDLLCYVAFSAPIRTRRERAERLRKGRSGLLGILHARGAADSGRDPGQIHRARRRPSSRCQTS